MPLKAPEEMLRPLQLTSDETQMIIEEAERIILETLAAHELFIGNDRKLPSSEWRHVKSRENVEVYRTRKRRATAKYAACSCSPEIHRQASGDADQSAYGFVVRPTTMSSSSDSSAGSSTSTSSDPICGRTSEITRRKPTSVPLVVATGIVAGTVEDIAFGALAHTERLTRHRDAQIQDESLNVKILATIVRPTPHDPYNSIVVKWSKHNANALSRVRDCVYIEANGIATDSNGEQVAYNLVHSIDNIPRIPGFKHLNIVRVNVSACSVARQFDQSSVEVFYRGFTDLGGNFADSVSKSVCTKMVLSVVHLVDCAYMKKLAWLTHSKRRRHLASGSSLPSPAQSCGNCATSLTKFGNLIHTGAVCRACCQEICAKCSVSKKLAIEANSTEVRLKSVTYCLHCVIEAKRLSTTEVAVSTMEMYG